MKSSFKKDPGWDDSSDDDVEIGYNDTVRSLFYEAERRNFEALKNDKRFNAFRKKIHEIQTVGFNKNLCEGEVLLLIARGYRTKNLEWDTIPYGEMDSVKRFVESVADDKYSVLCPQMAEYLKTGEFSYQEFLKKMRLIGLSINAQGEIAK